MDGGSFSEITMFGWFYQRYCRDWIIFVMIFLFIRLLVSGGLFKKSISSSNPLLPAPPGLPIVGNIFSFRTDMRGILRKWTNEIGGIFRLRVGPVMDIVVVSDIDAIHEAFIEKADVFSDRTVPPLVDVAMGQRGSFIFAEGDTWKKTRRFGHQALRTLGLGQRTMEDKIIEEGRILVQTCEMKEGIPFNPRVLMTNAVGNVISSLVFGFRYDYDDPVFEKVVKDIELLTNNFSLTTIGVVFPFLYYTPIYTNLRRPVQDTISYIKSIVGQHHDSFDANNARDIIDLYMMEAKRQKEQKIVVDAIEENLEWRLIFDLFAAGVATTSDSLQWAVLIVAQHPDIMKEIQKEIDDVIGQERSPKMADQELMPFTIATIMEVNRIRPVVPQGLPRYTNRDATVKGYHIPKDTVVIMNLWEVLNSPKYWDEPNKFNPYRFLSEDGKSIVNHKAFIPFGIGLRLCLGEKLARMQLFLIFTSLLQRFTLYLADDSLSVGMKGKAGITYTPLSYNIVLKKRDI